MKLAAAALAAGALAFASASSAEAAPACPLLGGCVTVAPGGPVPASLDVFPGTAVWFVGDEAATVIVPSLECVAPVFTTTPSPDRALGSCRFQNVGSYPYRVERPGWIVFGEVVVREPTWLTVRAAATRTVYGSCVRIEGEVYRYPHYGGPPPVPPEVHVFGRTELGTGEVRSTFASSGAVGRPSHDAWTTGVCPRAVSWYHAHSGGHETDEVRVDVEPRVTLARTRTALIGRIEPSRPFAGRAVALQRRTQSGYWRGLRTLYADDGARVRLVPRVHRGSIVRLAVAGLSGRAGPAFVAGASPPVVVR